MQTDKFDLFLSYDWQYHNEIINIHRILSKKGFRVWLDLVEIKFGDHIEERIQNAIRNSNAFICFISDDYIRSKNCEMEFYYACNENKKIYMILMEPLYKLNTNHMEKSFFLNHKNLLSQLNTEQISKDIMSLRSSPPNTASASSAASNAASNTASASSAASNTASNQVQPQQQQQPQQPTTSSNSDNKSANKKTFLESMASKIIQFFNLNFTTQTV